MKMSRVLSSVAVILGLSAGSTFASDGRISASSLAKMGLHGMKTMTDPQGMTIRGRSVRDTLEDRIDKLQDQLHDLERKLSRAKNEDRIDRLEDHIHDTQRLIGRLTDHLHDLHHR